MAGIKGLSEQYRTAPSTTAVTHQIDGLRRNGPSATSKHQSKGSVQDELQVDSALLSAISEARVEKPGCRRCDLIDFPASVSSEFFRLADSGSSLLVCDPALRGAERKPPEWIR